LYPKKEAIKNRVAYGLDDPKILTKKLKKKTKELNRNSNKFNGIPGSTNHKLLMNLTKRTCSKPFIPHNKPLISKK